MSATEHSNDDGHEHGHHGSPFIQHHYDDAKHQFEAGKLGIWVFLVTEILFFSGLFVAYILYRSRHPEIFEYAHRYLDVKWGAINTGVLIFSSFTAALAVRAAQRNQQRLLVTCLGITVICAFAFLGIKFIEYKAKFDHGTLWGCKFMPHVDPDGKPLKLVKPSPECKNKVPAEEKEPEGGYTGEVPPPNTGMFFSIYFALTGLHGIHVTVGAFVFIWLFWRARKRHFNAEYFGPVDYGALYWHLVDLIWIYLFPLLYLIS